jgi:adenine-specific DNA-methyltransferase
MPKKLTDYTREELLESIKGLRRRKKFGLVWEDKPEAVALQCENELPVLEEVIDRAISTRDNGETNLIIEGDNYHALSVLNYTHSGKIDVIYIDPPYNTGKKDFIYNDKYVDEEDQYKHSKWLSFMSKRLRLASSLLAENGVIIVHIDEHELDNLYLLLAEVFGKENDLGRILWDKRNPKGDSRGVSILHETILCFAKSKEIFLANDGILKREKLNAAQMLKKAAKIRGNVGKEVIPEDIKRTIKPFNFPKEVLETLKVKYDLGLAESEYKSWLSTQTFSEGEKAYKYLDKDGRVYRTASMAWPNNKQAPDEYFQPLIHPVTKQACPVPAKGWRNPPKTMADLLAKGLIVFGEDERKQPERKYYLDENMTENTPSILSYGGSDDNLLKDLKIKFDNPKPMFVANYLLKSIYGSATTYLDFFAGSGTTGHAVLALNEVDGGDRKFILVTNNENSIAEEATYARISSAIKGQAGSKGMPANLRYFKTGFVLKQDTDDQTRTELVQRSTEMICIREGAYN